MRKFLALLGACAMASVMPATPALAGGSVVIGDDQCGGFVPRADGTIDENNALITDESHQVIKGSTATLVCHFDIPDDRLPSKGMKTGDFICQKSIGGVTVTAFDQRMAASPGGRAVLTCKFLLTASTLKIGKK